MLLAHWFKEVTVCELVAGMLFNEAFFLFKASLYENGLLMMDLLRFKV